MDSPEGAAVGGDSFEEEDGTILSSDEIECPDWLHELEDSSRWEGEVRSRPALCHASVLYVLLQACRVVVAAGK
eukprot:COSAG02_NODE_2609_length_8435_cov_4.723129_5_plen_74_part_00